MTSLVKIETAKDNYLRVELIAANLLSFEVAIFPGAEGYHKTLADVCKIAPIMIRLDMDLMEMFDDAARTQPKQEDLAAVKKFAVSHSFREVDLPFSAFDSIR